MKYIIREWFFSRPVPEPGMIRTDDTNVFTISLEFKNDSDAIRFNQKFSEFLNTMEI